MQLCSLHYAIKATREAKESAYSRLTGKLAVIQFRKQEVERHECLILNCVRRIRHQCWLLQRSVWPILCILFPLTYCKMSKHSCSIHTRGSLCQPTEDIFPLYRICVKYEQQYWPEYCKSSEECS